jgi:hypothetical protein
MTFYDCSSLINVEIPNSVTTIGNNAFKDCRSLTSVSIPDSVTNISSDAFDGCPALISVEEWKKEKNKPSLTKWLFG